MCAMILEKNVCWMFCVLCCFLKVGDGLDLLEFIFGPRLGRNAPMMAKSSKISPAQTLVEQFGYPFEAHEVTSESGYVLSLHRIPHGIKRKPTGNLKKKPVALFQHGLCAASDSWLFRGPDFDLPYVLADAGYDVWLSNMRGNFYSRQHIYLSPDKDEQYWDFSIHEVALEDFPIIFDYILNITKQEELFFLGHSVGSTAGLIFCSLRPEYNKKIKLQLALAPLAYVDHPLTFGHKVLFLTSVPVGRTVIKNNIFNIFPRRPYFTKIVQILCSKETPVQRLCISLVFALVGTDYSQFNTSYIPDVVTYFPAGTSIFILQHALQMYLTGNFGPYDYGNVTTNSKKYNESFPSPYNLSHVSHPISLHYGPGDILVTEKDIEATATKLPNPIGKFEVPYKNFNHMDFMWEQTLKNYCMIG